jgi:inosine-uridine nucleoside N-ribohydrolase
VPGAVFPLVNTQPRTEAWEKRFGSLGYKGAWDPPAGSRRPDEIPVLSEGRPGIQPVAGLAPVFMIEQVHAHPHEVSIFAGGPLTNLALAVRLDPDFPRLVKELVFMGAFQHLPQPDFNVRFDPEAAHIVLTAPWPSVTSVGDVTSNGIFSSKAIFSAENVEKIRAAKTPIADFVLKYSQVDIDHNWSLWDELAAAVLIDPTVVTASEDIYLDVNIDHDMDYGRVHVWDDKSAPDTNIRKVRVVKELDAKRFQERFIKSMSASPTLQPPMRRGFSTCRSREVADSLVTTLRVPLFLPELLEHRSSQPRSL